MLHSLDGELEAAVDVFLDCLHPLLLPGLRVRRAHYGTRYLKIALVFDDHDAVSCFIALHDFENATMGLVRRGDVLYPNGRNAPARHARGNVFDAWHGVSGTDGTRPFKHGRPATLQGQ